MEGQAYQSEAFRLIPGFAGRLRGLLFTKPHGQTVMLVRCRSIHTFGMRHDLDIAFLDREAKVVAAYRNVAPRKHLGEHRAVAVIERFSNAGKPWPKKGERLLFLMEATATKEEQPSSMKI